MSRVTVNVDYIQHRREKSQHTVILYSTYCSFWLQMFIIDSILEFLVLSPTVAACSDSFFKTVLRSVCINLVITFKISPPQPQVLSSVSCRMTTSWMFCSCWWLWCLNIQGPWSRPSTSATGFGKRRSLYYLQMYSEDVLLRFGHKYNVMAGWYYARLHLSSETLFALMLYL